MPSHTFYELYHLMPLLDCGLCGNPTCRTTARKLAAGDIEPEKCINLTTQPRLKKNLQKIRQLIKEGIEIGAKGMIKEKDVTYIHPCVTEAGKIMAKARLTPRLENADELKYGFYDPIQLCTILNNADFLREARCSSKLGIAKVILNEKTVLIHKDGRITVRKAHDKEDVIRTIRLISRSVWGAIICSCGNTGVDCASGGCKDCLDNLCPVIARGPPLPATSLNDTAQFRASNTAFDQVKKLETGKYFEEGVRNLDTGFALLEQAGRRFLDDRFDNSSTLNSIDEKICNANALGTRFILETSEIRNASIGLILNGVAMDLTRIVNGLRVVFSRKSTLSPKMSKLLSGALEIATSGFKSWRTFDLENAKSVRLQYNDFHTSWEHEHRNTSEKDVLVSIEKMAVNGFYMSRLLKAKL